MNPRIALDRCKVALSLIGVSLALVPISGYAQSSHLIDLGAHTGYAINNAGQVALDGGIYQNGVFTPLPPIPGAVSITVLALSANGSATGWWSDATTPGATSDFTYINGSYAHIGGLTAYTTLSGTGINASGQEVGVESIEPFNNGIQHFGFGPGVGFFDTFPTWSCPHLLDPRTEGAGAWGINDLGQFTGTAVAGTASVGGLHAFIYQAGNWTDLGPGIGYAINANGAVTGAGGQDECFALTPPTPPLPPGHAFLYSAGLTTDLGVLAGGTRAIGYALNIGETVVGASDQAGSPVTHAFFYNGVINDMNALVSADDPLKQFVTLTGATGINDSRLIIVNGVDTRGGSHAYLLQAPWLDVVPGALAFGAQPTGTTSAVQLVTLKNSGAAPLPLDSVASSDPAFQQTNACSNPLPSGANCAVSVKFSPTASGDQSASLKIVTAGATIAIPLSGAGAIQIAVSASATTVTTGTAVTLTWTASPGATCTATGGSTADGWTGNIPVSGTQSVTESAAGTYTYGLACTSGSQSSSGQAPPVVVTWPVVSASLSASPASFTAGASITLTWSSANATSCSATGGGAGDTWPGARATSGSVTLTEPYAPAGSSLTLTYMLTCTSSVSGLSANASAKAVENAVMPVAKSGGGSIDLVSVLFLAMIVLRIIFVAPNVCSSYRHMTRGDGDESPYCPVSGGVSEMRKGATG